MLRCVTSGRLPGYEDRCDYLRRVLSTPDTLPSREEIKNRLLLPNEERIRHRLWSIAPIDVTAAQLAELRKQGNRERMRLARRKAGAESRAAYLAHVTGRNEPWKALGISKATYHRRKAKGETGFVQTLETPMRQGSCKPQGL